MNQMNLETRPLYLYRTAGERAVRAASPTQAAWAFASRRARREYGRRAGAAAKFLGISGDEALYEARIGLARDIRHHNGCETIYIRVRRA